MTKEDLLRPRYKVTSPYAGYTKGEILMKAKGYNHFRVVNKDGSGYGVDYRRDGIFESLIKKNPKCFKELKWWEDRRAKDLPEYVKSGSRIYQIDDAISLGKMNDECLPTNKKSKNEYRTH